MTVLVKFPTTNAAAGGAFNGSWTSPNNAHADDAVYATAAPGKNQEFATLWSGFDFSAIPAGSVINSVTVAVEYKVSTTASVAELRSTAFDDTTTIGSSPGVTDTLEPTTDTIRTYTIPATLSQLQSSTFQIRVQALRGNSNTAVTFSLDYVKVTVDYTARFSRAVASTAAIKTTQSRAVAATLAASLPTFTRVVAATAAISTTNTQVVAATVAVSVSGGGAGNITRRTAAETVNSTALASYDINKPTGMQDGDYVVLSIVTSGNTLSSAPTGFTSIKSEITQTNPRIYVYGKFVSSVAGEGTWTVSTVAGVNGSTIAQAYGGVDTTTPIDVTPNSASGSTGSNAMTVTGVTTVTNNALLLYHHAPNSATSTLTPPAEMTEDLESSGGRRNAIDYEVRATAGATGDRTGSAASATLGWAAILYALRPASSGATSFQRVVAATAAIQTTNKRVVAATAAVDALGGIRVVAATISLADPISGTGIGHWRWYTDNAVDTSMTALAAEDTTPTLTGAQTMGGILRLRVQLRDTGNITALNPYYSVDGTNYNDVASVSPNSTTVNRWIRFVNGAATANNTITTQLLSGSTASGKYHETTAVSETVGSGAIVEVDLAFKIIWPPPNTTVKVQLRDGSTAIPLATGASEIQFTTCTPSERDYTIDRAEPNTSGGQNREMNHGMWQRLHYDGTDWWFFTLQPNDGTNLTYYRWPNGSGNTWNKSTIGMTVNAATTSEADVKHNVAFRNISGTHVVSALFSPSSGNMHYRRGRFTGGAITWNSDNDLGQARYNPHSHTTIDDGGYHWIGGINGTSGVWACRSTAADDGTSGYNPSFGTISTRRKTVADATVASGNILALVPLASDKILVMWNTGSTLKAAVCTDASGFGSVVTVNSTASAHPADWGMTRIGNTVYVVHSDNTSTGGTWRARQYSISGDSWSAWTDPGAAQPTQNSNADGLVLVNDGTNVYAFGTTIGTEGGQDRTVTAVKWDGASWTNLGLITPAGGRGNGDDIAGPDVAGGGKIPIAYLMNDNDVNGFPFTYEVHTLAVAATLSRTVASTVAISTSANTRTVGAQAVVSVSGLTRTLTTTAAISVSAIKRIVTSTAAVATPSLTRTVGATAAISTAGVTRSVGATISVSTTANTRIVAATVALSTLNLKRTVTAQAVVATSANTRVVGATVSIQLTGFSRTVAATIAVATTANTRSVATSVSASVAGNSRGLGATVSVSVGGVRSVGTSAAVLTTNTRPVTTTAAISTFANKRIVASTAAISLTFTRSVASTLAVQVTNTRTVSSTAAVSTSANKRTVVTTISVTQGNVRSIAPTVAVHVTNARTVATTLAMSTPAGTTTRSLAATISIQKMYLVRDTTRTNRIVDSSANPIYITSFADIGLRTIAATAAVSTTNTRSVVSSVAIRQTNMRVVAVTIGISGALGRSIPTTVAIAQTNVRALAAQVATSTVNTRSVASTVAISMTFTQTVASTISVQAIGLKRTVASTAAIRVSVTRVIGASLAARVTLTRPVGATISVQAGSGRVVATTAAIRTTNTRVLVDTVAIQVTLKRQFTTTAAIQDTPKRSVPTTLSINLPVKRTVSATISISSAASTIIGGLIRVAGSDAIFASRVASNDDVMVADKVASNDVVLVAQQTADHDVFSASKDQSPEPVALMRNSTADSIIMERTEGDATIGSVTRIPNDL